MPEDAESDGMSTRPFSDIAKEHRKRFREHQPKALDAPLRDQQNSVPHGRMRKDLASKAAIPPAELQVDELIKSFKAAWAESPPGTRIVIALPALTEITGARPLPAGGGWNVTTVQQGIKDADFLLSLPLHDNSRTKPLTRERKLKVRILYDPQSDSCELINETLTDIFVTELTLANKSLGVQKRLFFTESCHISIGTYRISTDGEREQHLLDFCLGQRQFVVSSVSRSFKRRLDEDALHDGRNHAQKQSNLIPSLASMRPPKPNSHTKSGVLLSTEGIQSGSVSALDLREGDLLVVQDLQRAKPLIDDGSLGTYDIECRLEIDRTPGSRVFACRHSGLPDDLVAKVLNPRTNGSSLYDRVNQFKQEVTMLKQIDHPNIVKLISSDARLHIMCLEKLPISLQRQTPVSSATAPAILVGISSALEYLEKLEIIHNDIKPANIAYSAKRGAVLFDFGLARQRTRTLGGTSPFLSPEYLDEEDYHLKRGFPGEIWALGVTMIVCMHMIRYPKKNDQVENLMNLADKTTNDYRKLKDWHAQVGNVRKGLNKNDDIEDIIYRMLDPYAKTRITAAQIRYSLGQQTHSSDQLSRAAVRRTG